MFILQLQIYNSFIQFWNIQVNPALFGTRIREARERLNLSQEELAVLVSKDQRAISEYENGKRKLAVTDLPIFALVLHVPLLYFYEGNLNMGDLERGMLQEFENIPTIEAKYAAIEIIRIFSETIKATIR